MQSDHKQPRPLRVGLTGGIASGKSAVAELFAKLGATIIDTDVIARQVTEPGQQGLQEIVAEFGDDVLNKDGMLDRAAMRRRVFANDASRARLEAILHPLIKAATLARAEATANESAYQLVVVPLLLESDFGELVDRILVVDCPTETQRQRLMARDGLDQAAAEAMIAAQTSRAMRLAAADDVIENSSDFAALGDAVRVLHDRYLELTARSD